MQSTLDSTIRSLREPPSVIATEAKSGDVALGSPRRFLVKSQPNEAG